MGELLLLTIIGGELRRSQAQGAPIISLFTSVYSYPTKNISADSRTIEAKQASKSHDIPIPHDYCHELVNIVEDPLLLN